MERKSHTQMPHMSDPQPIVPDKCAAEIKRRERGHNRADPKVVRNEYEIQFHPRTNDGSDSPQCDDTRTAAQIRAKSVLEFPLQALPPALVHRRHSRGREPVVVERRAEVLRGYFAPGVRPALPAGYRRAGHGRAQQEGGDGPAVTVGEREAGGEGFEAHEAEEEVHHPQVVEGVGDQRVPWFGIGGLREEADWR